MCIESKKIFSIEMQKYKNDQKKNPTKMEDYSAPNFTGFFVKKFHFSLLIFDTVSLSRMGRSGWTQKSLKATQIESWNCSTTQDDLPLGLSQTPFHIPNPIEKSSSSKYAMATKFLYLLLLLFNFHFRLSFSGELSPQISSLIVTIVDLIIYCFQFLRISGQSNSMESVPDLQKSMYKVIDGYPCVRLLNLSGPIGCSSKFLNLSKLRSVL